jgi:prepilin signal peptidase PulO-like enzyme (type II secretory pathway)
MNLLLAYTASLAALLGLAIGSFLNVVISRLPEGESIVSPGSRCPQCKTPIRPYDNIPVLSFLLLRGRCRTCGTRISPLYPIIELLMGIVFVGLIVKHGWSWETIAMMAFACAIVALIFIDLRHHLLPNMITYPLFVFAIAVAGARAGWGERPEFAISFSVVVPALQTVFSASRAALIGGMLLGLATPGFLLLDWLDGILFHRYFVDDAEEEPVSPETLQTEHAFDRNSNRVMASACIAGLLLAAVWAFAVFRYSVAHPVAFEDAYDGLRAAGIGALVGGGSIWWLRTLYFLLRGVEGMGLGDVKLMCGIGAFLGWQGAFGVLLFGSILGAVVGVILAFRNKEGMQTPLPFGLCLGFGALLMLFTR